MGSNEKLRAPKDEYVLTRDSAETMRLSVQHWVFVQRQGWHLHPTISDALAKIANPEICDAATGTAIWANEIATQYKSANVVGVDISEDQFPPQYLLAPNLSLEKLDLLGDIPEHLQNRFDVVHVRLILSAGPGLSKDKLLASFHKLLKPGGWLQWDDLTWPPAKRVTGSETGRRVEESDLSETDPLLRALDKFVQMQEKLEWLNSFEEVVASKGLFTNAKLHRPAVVPHLVPLENELAYAVVKSMVGVVVEKANITDEAVIKDMEKSYQNILSERQQGLWTFYNWIVGVAQKKA